NVYEHKVRIQAEEQRIDFYKKDLSHLDQTEADTEAALSQLEAKLKSVANEIDELSKAKESFAQLSLFEETFLKDKEGDLATLELRIQGLQAEIENEKAALIEAANQIAYLKNDSTAKETRRAEINHELTRSAGEHAVALSALELCEQKRLGTQTSLGSLLEEARERGLETAQTTASIQSLTKAKEEQELKVEALKERIQENRSRLISLEDLQKNYEGYQEGVRAIMLKREQAAAPNGIYGLVAEVIEAPEPYEKALTAVLGDRLQYVIVKGQQEGVEAIEYLKKEASGRGSFIPRELTRKQHRPLPLGEAEVVAPLLDMISVKSGYDDVAQYLLSDVVVVRNLHAGLALWNRNGFYSTLVTPEGEVIDPMGIVTGGSDAPLETSLLTQRRRIKELRSALADLDAQLPIEEGKVEKLKEELDRVAMHKSALATEIHRLELDRVRLEHEHLSADNEHHRLGETVQVLRQEQHDLATALQLLDAQIQTSAAAVEKQLQEKADREQNLTRMLTESTELRASAEALEAAVTQSRIRNAALSEKRENAFHNLENRRNLQQETLAAISTRQNQVSDIRRHRTDIQNALMQTEGSLNGAQSHLRELEEQLQADRQRYKTISMSLADLEESIKELRPQGDAWQEEKSRVQLALAEKRLNLQHLADNTHDKYDVDIRELGSEQADSTLSREELIVEIEDLRGRLDRMGEVNLAAIGEYEELTARFKFMSQQKQDLEKSIADLQQTITKLNRICRLRFKESFEEINEKFEAIFPRLFRGGKAKLLLTDESDYLETGVDIVVQPPGKRLQSITLLSGGEKALTAVSLLFAIFLTKPSPFCFLDEVDAPLDDANIDRFNDLIREMSQFSQFVLVTHNKKTMQAAEMLYGITMAEPGVSKVVSVRMT
ncbi:MAG TPA: chromosome segregation protein SMC, partial [Candidatus Binatia bacterium]